MIVGDFLIPNVSVDARLARPACRPGEDVAILA
jgi:hypothetical protein